MRAAYTQWDGIIFKIAMVRNFVIYGIIYQIAGPLIVMNYLKKRKFVKICDTVSESLSCRGRAPSL